jgi:hypothetical protein
MVDTAASAPFEGADEMPVDRSVSGKVRRRTQFFVQYMIARLRSKKIARLQSIVDDHFKGHPWVEKVETNLRFYSGKENDQEPTHWDAPITVTVFCNRKKKPSVPAVCMSVYFTNSVLVIRQLQGVAHVDVPRDLFWANRFVNAGKALAEESGFLEVWIPKASSMYSYRCPGVQESLLPEKKRVIVLRIRKKIRLHYDEVALAEGFTLKGDWFVWKKEDKRP